MKLNLFAAAAFAAACLPMATGVQAAAPQMTQDSGAPVGDNQNSKAVGDFGGVMLEETSLLFPDLPALNA